MSIEKGFIWVNDVEATAVVPPAGHIVAARDTGAFLGSDGTVLTALGGGGAFNTEDAQDAVGAMVDSTLTYDDATPTLKIATDGVGNTQLRNSAALSVIGRSANSTGDPADIAGATVGHVLQVLSGPTIGFGANGVRRPSWDNPPASPHSYDDEFDAGTLDAKWTLSSVGTTNAATTGAIDYTATLTTPIIDATSVPSRLMFQSDNSSLGQIRITQSFTQATNETHFFKVLANQRNVGTNGEGAFYLELWNSSDANEVIGVGTTNSGSLHDVWAYVTNNGATGGTASGNINEGSKGMPTYIVIWKKADVYYFGIAGTDKGSFNVFTSKTKTGVTTFDRISLLLVTANETPSLIDGLDFYRYKASLDYSLVNV